MQISSATTTRVAPEAVEAMAPYLTDFYGNPSSVHRLAARKLGVYDTEIRRLRDRFETGLTAATPDIAVNGARSPRVPNTSNVRFRHSSVGMSESATVFGRARRASGRFPRSYFPV